MAIEIERKFLVKEIPFQLVKYSKKIRQGYIISNENQVIRVRKKDEEYFLTIKGNNIGISRLEFEYEIPKNDAKQLFKHFCKIGSIEKTRHYIENENHIWEVDEFHGNNQGLIVAEIELKKENEKFSIPYWVKKEVTSEEKYYNMNLTINPYKNWKDINPK